jgi:hypothetical protein
MVLGFTQPLKEMSTRNSLGWGYSAAGLRLINVIASVRRLS